LEGNAVSDLTPLAGLTLTDLLLRNKQISDLSPLAGMPLLRLHIFNSSVSDLRPLQGMPLQEFRFDPQNITQGLDVLREIKTLQTIGTGSNQAWPPAEFWERYDKGEFNK
jgi:Leucine-rich repeat (LRR) protein